MVQMSYPGLYHEADDAASRQQRLFLDLVKGEYTGLFVAAIFSLDILDNSVYYIIYAIVFAVPFALLLVRSFLKPEQGWYQARALAESIKTSTWKYVMRAQPFGGVADRRIAHSEFRNHLKAILDANRHVGRQFDSSAGESSQINREMEEIRALPVEERLAFYARERIDSQRTWYAKKAVANRRWARHTVVALSLIYLIASLLLLVRVAKPTWRFSHPEPLIVIATALVGWSHLKRFNELATAYGLTAHEIGILKTGLDGVGSDEELSLFVDDAEQAFSREHTQWIARQSS